MNAATFLLPLCFAAVLAAVPFQADAARPGPGVHDRDGRPGAAGSPNESLWEEWKNRKNEDKRPHDRAGDGPSPWEKRRKDERDHSRSQYERKYPPPSEHSGYVWVEGHWNERDQWVPGYWKPKAAVAGLIWVPGEWDGNAWVRGFWRVAKKPGYVWSEGFIDETGRWAVGHWQKKGQH